jgi:2'-5' RNA ligase
MTLARGFLAIPVPQDVRPAIVALQSELAARGGNLRWAHPEMIHLTLHFFGRVTEENLEKIRASMLSVGLQKQPFQVAIQGLGVFPNRHRPRVLWLGLVPEEPLRALYTAWQEALRRNDMQPEAKPFTPHLTIGRFRQRSTELEKILADPAGTSFHAVLPVERLVLYESRLTPGRAEHIPVHSVFLGK